MKAAFLKGARDICIEEIAKPEPAAGEALIKVAAVGICGTDINYYKYGRISSRIIDEPHIPGHEISGIIESVEENTCGLTAGMPVGVEPSVPCGSCESCLKGEYNLCKQIKFFGSMPYHGGLREYMAVPLTNLFPLPEAISIDEGVLIETFSVGVHSLDLSKLKLGDTVAIFGAGSIGLSHLQLALLAGALDVYVVDILDYRLTIAREMGAASVINARREDPVERIMRLTNGRGVDVGFEAAGVPETPQQTMNIIAQGGTFMFVGIVPDSVIQWDTELARIKGITIEMIRRSRHGYERALNMVRRNKLNIKPFITHRFPLEEAQSAFETAAHYKDNVLKAVIKP